MKEDVAEASKMLNKNWVLKRKRRKIPSGLDSSTVKEENSQPLESVLNNPSSKRGVKDEVASTRSSSKKKGHDGYYYECVVCDLGGNLLCCESCPRTYHIQCLEPPLKRIPTGKWECPKCYQKTDPLGPTSPLDSVSKRARTKVTTTGKSKSENKSSGSTKMSKNIGGSILDNRRLSSKEKSSLSQRVQKEKLDPSPNSVSSKTKLNHASGDGSAGCSSSYVSVEDEPEEKKPISPGKGVTSLSNVIDSKTNEEASVRRPRLSSTDKSPMDKCITLMDSASRKERKRKHDFFPVDSWKKRRTDKSNHTAKTKKSKSESNSAHPGANKSQRKLKSINHESSKILPEQDVGKDTVDEHLKERIVSEGASHPSNELGKVTVEPVTNEESGLDALQVDRVLGCRVRDADARNSCNTLVAPANDPQSEGSPVPKDENKLNDGNPSACDVGLNEIASTDGSQGLADCPDEGRITKNDILKDKFQVYRRSVIKDCKEGVNSARTEDEVSGDYLANEEEFAKTSEKTSKETDSCVEIRDSNDNMECSQNFASNQLGNAKVVDTALETSSTSQKKHKGSTLAESSNSNGVTVSYEFLIKWVGKSNIHNTWLPESELKTLAKRKLDNYKAKYGTATINICEEQWKIPQRVIAVRSASNGATEVFVKWTGLSYDECTWERIDEPVISKASHLIDLFHKFESQALDKDAIKDDTLKKRNEQQSDIASLTEQPKELQGGLLFPHQMEALNWLRKCWYKSKNVILADEMGLGKTVSACAFLSSVYFEFKARLPSLVLVPLSTLPNWMAEFALWAPEINVVDYHGSSKARTIIRQYEWHASNQNGSNKKTTSYKFNVLLTTYEMVLADLSNLRGIPWEVLVVDEGHRLKNSSSKLFGSLNTFSFQHRVLLTGTPLQNNIGEMYNLLNFLQPTSFPSLSSFERKFNDLTTAEKVDELKKLVAPHMLRRLKKDAMQNIPPKTERMVPVELTSIQAEYYRAMLTKNYQVLRNIGKGVAQQSMLNIVMQLRKVCNHPYLIPGTEPETGSLEFLHEMRIKASAKLAVLHSMLKVLHKEGHRVLIFSQMTKLLDILEDYLTIEFGPKTYERVDGSVSVADRQASIARFNQDKSRFVFLLSTRSCGLGINLATADTVIIYDSDFNPHADIQAMNRAHRIGQSKRLLVYRLVVRASVEERILQLAKKKLMLDQLFVNKSGSQKEVEDILRWGTEELFSDSSNTTGNGIGENLNNKIEAVLEIEQKHRRKTGSLGDVYKDKCAEISTKIVWDENAIFKLLDRSNLQSDSPDSNEAELETDMLGSVKSSEWNEEATEEQAGEMMLANDDTSTQNLEKKDDNLIGSSTEENEWDRLLRVRWEKHQSEEEAVLGRGKRQRKAVSYREAYAAHPNETLSESGAEEDQEQKPEPELEPEREYTPAGRALKAKYTRLRARQKERLAKRNAKQTSAPVEGSTGTQYFPQFLQSQAQDGIQSALSIQPSEENSSALFLDGSSCGQTSEGRKNRTDSTIRLVKLPKCKLNEHLGQPNLGEGPSYMNSEAENPLVIGLCAPNANPMESSQRKFSRSYNRKNRLGLGPDLPPGVAPCPTTSDEMGTKAHETISGRFKLPDPPLDVSQSRSKISIPDLYHPFNSHPLIFPQGKGSTVNLENSASSFAAFQEKMALPKLPFDEKLLPRYPFPTGNFPRPHPDLFPSLSLGSRVADVNEPHHDHPTMPLFPNLKFPMPEAPRCNQQEPEVPPTLGLGQMPSKLSPFPENHRKVLENIMLRTGSGSGSGNLFKKKSKMDIWSEEELDNLWIGVRRHGRGNWDAMLRDPRLKFSKFKTVEDLSMRWEEEQTKILDVPAAFPGKGLKPPKSGKSSLFPCVSDGMMTRALHGSKFSGPLKFQNQFTDLKLGFGDLPPSLSRLEHADHLSHISPLPTWNPDKYPLNVPGDLNAGPSDRLGAPSKFLMESPLLLSSLGTSSLGSLGLNCPASLSLPQKEAEESASRFGKLSSILDRSLNFLPDSNNNVGNGESSGFALPSDVSKGKYKGKEVAECSSPKNKLPHWLQEAVNVPPKSAAPSLPPTLSAISHSVRLLYGEENPTIPPFTVPGPLPSQPKDPRLSLKKKKKKKKKLHMMPEFLQSLKGSGDNLQSHLPGEKIGSSVVPQDQSSFTVLKSLASTSESPSIEPDLGMSTLSQNVMNPSSSPANPSLQKMTTPGLSPSPEVLQLVASLPGNPSLQKMTTPGLSPSPEVLQLVASLPGNPSLQNMTTPGLSPSPEVLQLVASCVAPDPPPSPTTDINENTAPPPLSANEGTSPATHEKANDTSAPGKSGSSEEDKDQSESRDSSQTQSDPARGRQHAVEEVSSEETVSDHLAIEP